MKIAVLVVGEYREFAIAHKSWKFLNYPEVDVFMSTWSTSREVNLALDINLRETVTEEQIRALIDVKHLAIFDQSTIHPNIPQRKMTYLWRQALMMLAYQTTVYDVVIMIRPDLYLEYDTNIFHELLSNLTNDLYLLGRPYSRSSGLVNRGVQDQMFVSTHIGITNMLRIHEAPDVNIHEHLVNEFELIYDELRSLQIDKFAIVRSNCRILAEDDLVFDNIRLKTKQWWESKNGPYAG